jgi:small subunit ribosomal protein S18
VANYESQSYHGNRRYAPRRKVCYCCVEWRRLHRLIKNVDMLYRYVSDHGKIRPSRQTGICAKHQRLLAKAIKRARNMALLPFVSEKQR